MHFHNLGEIIIILFFFIGGKTLGHCLLIHITFSAQT